MVALQLLSLLAAAGEVANLGALLPFLRLLADPRDGLNALGPLARPLQALPSQHLLLIMGLAFMAVVVLSTALRVFTTHSQLRLAGLIATDLSDQVFSEVLRRPFSWHLEQNSSALMGHLTHDVEQVAVSVKALLLLAINLAVVVLLGGSLVALAPGVMLVVAPLLAVFYALVFHFTRGSMRVDGQRARVNFQSSLQLAQEAIGGIRDVLLDRSQNYFRTKYLSRVLSYRLAMAANATKAQVPRYLIEGFAVLLIVGLSLSLALRGQGIEQQLPLLGTLALGAYRLLQPLQQCFSSVSTLQANQASLVRLRPFFNSNVNRFGDIDSQPHQPLSSVNPGSLVELAGVSFRYSSDTPWVLRDLNLVVPPGERLAFVGTTGSGKSTCSDLILGLLQPTSGHVLVQGENLHGSHGIVRAWQDRVAHVPQYIYLSDASFASNIAFGIPEDQIDHCRVRLAAQQARIAEMIESSPEGYNALVGERGVRLSGGQRQRIGIARALYKRADVLVLDEATSALDNRTEAEVMGAIEDLSRDITVILIAHRLSTVQRCDRIIYLEHGQIIGAGTYSELKMSNSRFEALVTASASKSSD
ncbi:ABC transporter ATP-binding protein [Synechococcus sp. CS-1327]|uniref:ABC transporter ATP-binding protein n=1 Tax=Synechococcus sp. CS-1327 TaxID=2847977 RepID=UPI00223ABFE5|nr:ABC transporter ATP-binding protein [Synechococcus sp. CS-1327]MCT0233357.1 ABC transporter ATP-binding protein/permease [Synechococcus sp. CS-1327]